MLDMYTVEELKCFEENNGSDTLNLDPEPEISLRAVNGGIAPYTMRMIVQINGISVIAVLDTGSTLNFVSKEVVEQLKIPHSLMGLVNVKVASGKQMNSMGLCQQVPLSIQGLQFKVDFYILDLNDYDIVLGTKWLKQLGPLLGNLTEFSLSFQSKNVKVSLKGLH